MDKKMKERRIMKKIVTLVLAIALLMTSVVAIAETHATPNVNSFATMKTKYSERNGVITITLTKPVDRLLVKWAEKGAEPEELAVDENLQATALTWGHKYMPGTEQKIGTSTIKDTIEKDWVEVKPSEWEYQVVKTTSGSRNTPAYFVETTTKEQKWTFGETYTDAEWAVIVRNYKEQYPAGSYDIVKPSRAYIEVDGKDTFGNPIKVKQPLTYPDGSPVINEGHIQGISVSTQVNKKLGTVVATPAQTAYMTVQGEWAVYYNRAGKIVGIEYFDGQF